MSELPEVALLHASIERVWNERDDAARLVAIGELYHPEAIIFEPARAVTGHAAISAVVAGVLADMPAGFRFAIDGPGLGHHGVATARWKGGPPGEVLVSGVDVARAQDGKLIEHYFFFNPAD
ncbi:nuclear transport factor 2 family protein [Sphingomonas azotifigens]|uniref:nuclear transport factor 2 family protein n=1 Tax=Sphingomonas azotifigens TaxID=330920 RepID=UPI0009FC6E77|nr:nuclear transport factor 2 family protein [Sphingomonas azotifigens]